MPGYLLHLGAQVMCAHGGQALPAATVPRVTVAGQPAVTMSAPYTVAGCPFATPGGPLPCVTAQWVTSAVRVTAGGAPVLLQDSQAVTVPNGVPLSVLVVQPRVKGI